MLPVVKFHRKVLGSEPTARQRSFYEMGSRGFSVALDEELFAATFLLAVYLAKDGPVVIAIPKAIDRQILQAITYWTRGIYRRFKGRDVAFKDFTNRIHQLQLATRLLVQTQEPARWVSMGLSKEDPIPEWLKNRLL
jgi:hypothetical protein